MCMMSASIFARNNRYFWINLLNVTKFWMKRLNLTMKKLKDLVRYNLSFISAYFCLAPMFLFWHLHIYRISPVAFSLKTKAGNCYIKLAILIIILDFDWLHILFDIYIYFHPQNKIDYCMEYYCIEWPNGSIPP